MQNKISEIRIVPVKARNGLVALASVIFDRAFYLGSIGIVTRPDGGYRLAYPTRKSSETTFNTFRPLNRDIANKMEIAVISKFKKVTGIVEDLPEYNDNLDIFDDDEFREFLVHEEIV